MSLNHNAIILHYRLGNELGEGAFDPEFRVAGRRTLFEGDFVQYRWQRQYDIHPDGTHFVMIENPPRGHLEVVLDWYDELERLVARDN